MKFAILFAGLALLTGCATGRGGSRPSPTDLGVDLKVTSIVGKLKAKLTLTNTSQREVVVDDLEVRFFHVETVDGKPMAFKGKSAPGEALHIAPGASAESAFVLQDSYPFWDRRTKYKIWYESSNLKSNVVQVWF